MRGICEVCLKETDVVLTIYGETGESVLRCCEHLNVARDFKAKVGSVKLLSVFWCCKVSSVQFFYHFLCKNPILNRLQIHFRLWKRTIFSVGWLFNFEAWTDYSSSEKTAYLAKSKYQNKTIHHYGLKTLVKCLQFSNTRYSYFHWGVL